MESPFRQRLVRLFLSNSFDFSRPYYSLDTQHALLLLRRGMFSDTYYKLANLKVLADIAAVGFAGIQEQNERMKELNELYSNAVTKLDCGIKIVDSRSSLDDLVDFYNNHIRNKNNS